MPAPSSMSDLVMHTESGLSGFLQFAEFGGEVYKEAVVEPVARPDKRIEGTMF